MSKQANAEILKQLINSARNNDAVLNNIIQVANGAVAMDNAANMAVQLANVLLGQGQGDEAVAAAMINGFKAVLYADWTTATNRRLNDANMHNNLINMRNQIVQGLGSQGAVTPAVPGNGTSIFTTSGTSGSNVFSDNSSAGLFSGAPAANNSAPSGANLFGAPATPAAEPVFATAPTAEQPKPAAAAVVVNAAPQKVINVEKYQDHELTIDYSRAGISPRRTNEAIKQYTQSHNWADELEKAMETGDQTIVFGDSDVIGKFNVENRVFLGGKGPTKEITRSFINAHNSAITSLNDLELEDDTPRIMTIVMKAIEAMRASTLEYINSMTEKSENDRAALMDGLNMAGVYQERLNKYLIEGFRIGTGGFVAPNGKSFAIDNVVVDMKEFSTDVYNSFCDGNGVCAEDDYFRDMFLVISRAILKLSVVLTEEGEIRISETTFTFLTAGEYNNIDKDRAVSVNTFGPALANVITDVYHRLTKLRKEVWMSIRTPHKDVLLLSSEDGSVVRY